MKVLRVTFEGRRGNLFQYERIVDGEDAEELEYLSAKEDSAGAAFFVEHLTESVVLDILRAYHGLEVEVIE